MAVVVTDAGMQSMASRAYYYSAPATYQLRPYVNDYTPTPESERSDFDNDAFPGNIIAYGYDEGESTINVNDHVAYITWPDAVFTVEDECVVYGYFWLDNDTDTVMFAERFDEPQVFTASGGTLTITPRLAYGACPC